MDRHNCTDTISGSALSSALPLSWRGWLEDGKNLFIAEIKQGMIALKLRAQRARSRRCLAHMDEHQLQDIGMSAAQARKEAAKCFWED